uniref:G-protein coupled receptors family 1 profile domain-containing protein n=1 Tax=Ditylenchus dipsaci TaxID=166011 RepID=A0A915E8G9_9BILA
MAEYLAYLNLVYSVAIIFCQLVVLTTMSRILIVHYVWPSRLTSKGMSVTIIIYLAINIFDCLVSVPFQTYLLVSFQADKTSFDIYLLYWLGFWSQNCLIAGPVAIFCLTLERYLAVTLSLRYDRKFKCLVIWLQMTMLFVIYSLSCFTYLLELPLDLAKVSQCGIFSCLLTKYRNLPQLGTKVIFGLLNISLSVLFFRNIRKNMLNIKNRAVWITLVLEVCLNSLPTFIGFSFNAVTGTSFAIYAGQYAIFLSNLDSALCGIFYTFILMPSEKRVEVPVTSLAHNRKNNLSTYN